MKFDPYAWQEVSTNEEVPFGKGRLRLRLSARAPLYITSEGFEALVGIEETFEVDFSEEVTFRVDGPVGLRVFMFVPGPTAFESVGEVFTNPDRLPMESGSMAEVTRAMRLFELERRNALKEIRAETEKLMQVQARRTIALEEREGESEVVEEVDDAPPEPVAEALPVDQPKAEPAKKGGKK